MVKIESDPRAVRLADFVRWARDNITGDEKGQAQIFLDRLFIGLGHKGCLDVGGTLEFRVVNRTNPVSFADYVWKPFVLIEMKKRGTDLTRHYRQAFDYWVNLVPGRPRYAILCNFDEFWVYDFETQMDEPVDRLPIDELPTRFGPLAFLFPTPERPVFGNDQEEVTRRAADLLAVCFNKLVNRKVSRSVAQRFILQMLVALFAEDIGLLEKYFVTRLLEDCKSKTDSFDLLGGLFEAMNTPGGAKGGRYKGVRYFNGGLFKEPARIELYEDEINQLRAASKSKWSSVRPEIFGTLFEHSLGEKESHERHAFGAHFTHPTDIMKIVGPTIVEPWRALIENASSLGELERLRLRMQTYRVLDPACGSGNFLYIAYRELKRLEARLLERIAERAKGEKGQRQFGFVTAAQFFGMDINPFAVEIAKVTMMIARKLAIDELHVDEHPLPLDNLDANFLAGDALITPYKNGDPFPTMLFQELNEDPWAVGRIVPTPWPAADVIIGNPPFLGAKRLKPERGADYVNAVRRAFPEVPGMADYCVYWFRLAHDRLPECTTDDPVAGRAGLVGTQNVRNNQSRVGGLDHVAASGTIVEAVDNQPWSGEANVHVSIVNWVKTKNTKLLPKQRRLWSKVDAPPGSEKIRKRGDGPAAKEFDLRSRTCSTINASLSDQVDVTGALQLDCNTLPQRCFQGIVTGYPGFVTTLAERAAWIKTDKLNAKVVKPYLIGRDLVLGDGRPTRAVIDFGTRTILDAAKFETPFKRVKRDVMPDVVTAQARAIGKDMAAARKEHLDRWWQFWNVRQGMRRAFSKLHRFVALSRVTKRPIFCFVSTAVIPDGKIQAFALEDDYSFGLLQSHVHWTWFVAKCAKLTERFSYSPRAVFNTFPCPQQPTKKHIRLVAKSAREVRRIRGDALSGVKGGLRAVYRMLELPGDNPLKEAHAALDQAVLDAYGFSERDDLLQQLLDLNLEVADRIAKKKPVTAPGVPPDYGDPADLITADCIQPE